MRNVLLLVVTILLIAGLAGAAPLVGKEIKVQGGEQPSVYVPISLPADGTVPEKGIQVVNVKTKKAYPATFRDGTLTFVLDALPAKETMTLKVAEAKQKAPKVAITKKGDAPQFEVVIGGEPFTTYQCSNDNRKPFLWPVYGEGKVGMTRDWPMDPSKAFPEPKWNDHIHHKGIWTSFGNVNGADCWGEDTDRAGYQHSDDVTSGSGNAYGWIHAKNTWQDKEHKPVIAEEREYRFYDAPAGLRIFDETITFTAAYGEVKFADTKEGGLVAFRIRPDLVEEKGKSGNGTGVITNASGEKGEKACWGKKSPWSDYYGEVKGTGIRGIAVFDTPGNLRYPTNWHIRAYGLNGANCFGLSSFTDKKENGDFTLENGKSITFKYRVVIHSGDAEQAKLADRYADYTTPPKAEFVSK